MIMKKYLTYCGFAAATLLLRLWQQKRCGND